MKLERVIGYPVVGSGSRIPNCSFWFPKCTPCLPPAMERVVSYFLSPHCYYPFLPKTHSYGFQVTGHGILKVSRRLPCQYKHYPHTHSIILTLEPAKAVTAARARTRQSLS